MGIAVPGPGGRSGFDQESISPDSGPPSPVADVEVPGIALARASQAILSTREVERLPEVIVREAMRVMSADAASVMLPGLDGKLYIAHAYGIDPEIQKKTRITIGEGIAGKVAESRQPLIIGGGRANTDEPGLRRHGRAKSSIVYPIVSGTQLLGLLTFNRQNDDAPYSANDLGIASVFATQVLLALENIRFARQSVSSEKLAAVGALAAGIAHEINTPMQFVGDNVAFVADSLADVIRALERYRSLCAERGASEEELQAVEAEYDLEFLRERMPRSLDHARDGLRRVADIVQAVKSFGHEGGGEKGLCDVNKTLLDALVLGRGEYKDVADVVTNLGEIPHASGYAGELSQVFLNLIVNASHAIHAAVAGGRGRGSIAIETRQEGERIVVTIRDDGCGIPEQVQDRIFEPFFTTKEVGRGTGLGLSIARTIIVDRHGGTLAFESEVGRGTVFHIGLPVESGAPRA
jgi:signal transduction histidine kinase